MVRTQTSSPIPLEAAGIRTNPAARIVELFGRRFGKAYDAGIWKRLSNLFLEPANPFDVKTAVNSGKRRIALGTFILTALGLAPISISSNSKVKAMARSKELLLNRILRRDPRR
jgi:hypothetical protein